MRRFLEQSYDLQQERAKAIDTMDRLLAVYVEVDDAREADDPERVCELRAEAARLLERLRKIRRNGRNYQRALRARLSESANGD